MYSPTVAYEAGRRLGRRQQDIWLSEDELWSAVQQEIAPQVRPRSGAKARDAQGWQSVVALLTTVSMAGIAVLLLSTFYGQADWMPSILSQLRPDRWWWAEFILICLTILTAIQYRWSARRARAERRRLRDQLLRAAYQGATEIVTTRRTREHRPGQTRSVSATSYVSRGGAGIDLTPRQAEELAARWMRSMGARSVEVTQFRGDGGVDVSSLNHIAQVKHLSGNVGVAPVRELSGVVRVDGRRGLFFTTSGYSTGAIEFAHQSGIALFTMNHRTGQLFGINEVAKSLQKHGLT